MYVTFVGDVVISPIFLIGDLIEIGLISAVFTTNLISKRAKIGISHIDTNRRMITPLS
eukprot:UN13960